MYWLSPRYAIAPDGQGAPTIRDSEKECWLGPLVDAEGLLAVLPEHLYLAGESPTSVREAYPSARKVRRYG